jgi:hypothetical protein
MGVWQNEAKKACDYNDWWVRRVPKLASRTAVWNGLAAPVANLPMSRGKMMT